MIKRTIPSTFPHPRKKPLKTSEPLINLRNEKQL